MRSDGGGSTKQQAGAPVVLIYSEWLEAHSRTDNSDARGQYDQYLASELSKASHVVLDGKTFNVGTDSGRFAAQKAAHASTDAPFKGKPAPPGPAGSDIPDNIPRGQNDKFLPSGTPAAKAKASGGTPLPRSATATVTDNQTGKSFTVSTADGTSGVASQSSLGGAAPAAAPPSTADPSIITAYNGGHPVAAPGKLNTLGDDFRHGTPQQSTVQSVDDLTDQLAGMAPADLSAMQQKLHQAGYNVKTTGIPDSATIAAYQAFLSDVYNTQKAGHNLTPDQVLDQMIVSQSAGGPQTQTSQAVDLTDPTTAQGILNTALREHLGRKATPDEVAAFTAALQAAQKANPKVQTTTGTQDQSSSTTQGGLDPAQFADDFVMQQHGAEANASQIGSLFSLAMGAINNPMGG